MNHTLPFAKQNFGVAQARVHRRHHHHHHHHHHHPPPPSLPFPQERDFILQRLHDCALPAIQPSGAAPVPNSSAVRERALECCTRIVELYYTNVDPNYVVALYNITTVALDLKTNTPEDVMLQAINFWSTLAQVEGIFAQQQEEGDASTPSKNLAVAAAGTLLPLLLSCIHGDGRDYREEDPDAEDDSHNPYTAAAECLGHFASLMKNDILPHVSPFLANLRSKDWKAREAALFSFAQIMDGPTETSDPHKDVGQLISQVLPAGICPLLLDDSSQAVRHAAAFALGRAVKFFHPAVLRVYETPDKFYLSVVQMLDPSRSSAKDPRTVEFYLWTLRTMCEEVHATSSGQHILPGCEIIFQALLSTADRPDASQSDLRSVSFEVLCEFVKSCSDQMLPYVSRDLMPNLMQRLYTALKTPLASQSDLSARSVVVAKVISCLGSIFQRFSATPQATAELAALLKSTMAAGSCADQLVILFLEALPADAELERGSMCAEEVVLAAAQMSKIVNVDFLKYMPALHPKMLTFMRTVHAGDLAYITCTSIGDIVRSVGPSITTSTQALLEYTPALSTNPFATPLSRIQIHACPAGTSISPARSSPTLNPTPTTG